MRVVADSSKWKDVVDALDYAFQPIVSISTGACLGYEALLRGWQAEGFHGIHDVFDAAYRDGVLFRVELWLREKAIRKFTRVDNHRKRKMFFNIDNRVLLMPDYTPGATSRILADCGIHSDSVCFELSEKYELNYAADAGMILNTYKRQGYKIAIDDFGTGYSGLQLLYHSEPDFIKIDRFFIAGIETDMKKKLFVGKVLNLAHTLGIMVIAEGIETEREYAYCKEIGCDYVQGYFVQKPITDTSALRERYPHIARLNAADRREKSLDHVLINDQMQYLEPIHLHARDSSDLTAMSAVFEKFRSHKDYRFFPVINGNEEPIGIINESNLKEYVYSRYGKDLLLNPAGGKTILEFIEKCPISEISTRIEKILECFAMDNLSEGLLMTESGRYVGFLSARSLLRVIYEKNIAIARDQNPLTRLPGNTLIAEFLENLLEDAAAAYVIAYFDFDDFKPFNDKYGFRHGDRAILLFSDILKNASATDKFFVGHIGGDDFFCGFKVGYLDDASIQEKIRRIGIKFAEYVRSIYDPQDRERGFILSSDRDGRQREYPLLTVSTAILTIPRGDRKVGIEEVGTLIAGLKKKSKVTVDKIAAAALDGASPAFVGQAPKLAGQSGSMRLVEGADL